MFWKPYSPTKTRCFRSAARLASRERTLKGHPYAVSRGRQSESRRSKRRTGWTKTLVDGTWVEKGSTEHIVFVSLVSSGAWELSAKKIKNTQNLLEIEMLCRKWVELQKIQSEISLHWEYRVTRVESHWCIVINLQLKVRLLTIYEIVRNRELPSIVVRQRNSTDSNWRLRSVEIIEGHTKSSSG